MTCEKRDMEAQDSNTDKEHETTLLFISRLDDWIMAVLKWLRTDENRGGRGQKHFVEMVQRFLSILMKHIIW